MAKNIIRTIILILVTLLLVSCVEDTVMHSGSESYLHKDTATERKAVVIEDNEGLAQMKKFSKNYFSIAGIKGSAQQFIKDTSKVGMKDGGSNLVFQQDGYLHFPIESGKYTNQYGWRTLSGKPDYHTGDDFSAPVGTPVQASLTGTVVRDGLDMTSCGTGGGCNITIEGELGGQKVRVAYLHLKEPPKLKVGDHVTVGQVIAYTGNTGKSTGAHLHMEVMIQETYQSLGLNAGRPIVTSMLNARDLKGAKDEWWWSLPLSWSRVEPNNFFKETEGVKSQGQLIKRNKEIKRKD